jgi:hypothetical protein
MFDRLKEKLKKIKYHKTSNTKSTSTVDESNIENVFVLKNLDGKISFK